MKKLMILLFLLGVISISFILFRIDRKSLKNNKVEEIIETIKINAEHTKVILKNMYVYGNKLNIEGEIPNKNIKNIELLIKSNEEKIVPLILTKNDDNIIFKISNEINNGLILDSYTNPIYLMFIKVTDINDDIKYYSLMYPYELTYYTLTNNNENYKIIINNSNKYNTISFLSNKTNEKTYDIIIDPGHGGIDSGACLYKNKTCERDYTPLISKKTKEILEENGYKVAYTWDIDAITNNDIILNYGKNSRTGRTYETHAKYTLSVHMNSSSSRKGSGFEIYTPYNIKYDLANTLKENISKIIPHSSNVGYRVYDGIYTRTFTTYDLIDIKKEREKQKLEPLNVSTKTNYYFMIRETAGKLGDAYVDGTTNSEGSTNIYRDYRVTSESYILELGYISNSKDVAILEKNIDNYALAIANSIMIHIEKEKSAN